MKNALLIFLAPVLLISAKVSAELENELVSALYTDKKVEFFLPENTVLLNKEICLKNLVERVPRNLTNFRCSKVLHNNTEYLILKNTAPKTNSWLHKIMVGGDQMEYLGDFTADYDIVPVLFDNQRLEFLAVSVDKWSQFRKEDRKVSYKRYQLNETEPPTLSPVTNVTTSKEREAQASRLAAEKRAQEEVHERAAAAAEEVHERAVAAADAHRLDLTERHGEEIAKYILAGNAVKGMTSEQVLEAVGAPLRKESIPPDFELWIYQDMKLSFSDHLVTHVDMVSR